MNLTLQIGKPSGLRSEFLLLCWGGSNPFSRVEMDIGWQALRLKIVLASFPLVLQLKSWILNRWGKKIGKLKANPSQLTELTLPQSIMATIFDGQMLNATCLLWTLFKLVAVWKNVYLHFLIYIYIHTLYYFLFIYIYLCVFLNMNRVCYVTEVAPSTRFRQLSEIGDLGHLKKLQLFCSVQGTVTACHYEAWLCHSCKGIHRIQKGIQWIRTQRDSP